MMLDVGTRAEVNFENDMRKGASDIEERSSDCLQSLSAIQAPLHEHWKSHKAKWEKVT